MSLAIVYSYFWPLFSKRTTLCQNIQILPRYTLEDAAFFIVYMCNWWNIKLKQEQMRWIENNLGGHYILIKEVLRQIVKSPNIEYEEIENLETLHIKTEALINNFLEDERKVLNKVARAEEIGSELNHSKEFLIKLGWLVEKDGKLEMTVPYVKKIIIEQAGEENKSQSIELVSLTKLERKVLEYFKNKTNSIISREEIAKIIWQDDWEEKYSDWSIDQIIHRIRDKIISSNAPYEIITKKGEGFIFLTH